MTLVRHGFMEIGLSMDEVMNRRVNTQFRSVGQRPAGLRVAAHQRKRTQ